jgi:hypothetical protein
MMVKSPHRRARRTMRLAANSTCLHQIFATTRALSQRDPRRRPARHGCPVGIKSPAEAGQGLILEGIEMKMCVSHTQIAAVLRQLNVGATSPRR